MRKDGLEGRIVLSLAGNWVAGTALSVEKKKEAMVGCWGFRLRVWGTTLHAASSAWGFQGD